MPSHNLVSAEVAAALDPSWWQLAADDTRPELRDDARRVILGLAVTAAYRDSVQSVGDRERRAELHTSPAMQRLFQASTPAGDFPRPMGVVMAERERAARCDYTKWNPAEQRRERCLRNAGHVEPHQWSEDVNAIRPLGVPGESLPDPADADPRHP